ncbi:Bystin, partial [Armadillidium vulgare]
DTDVNVSLVKEGVKKTFRKRKRVDGRDDEDSDAESVDEIDDAIPLNVEKTVKDFEDQLDLDNEDRNILDHFKKKESSSRQKRLTDLFRSIISEKHIEIESVVDNTSEKGKIKLKPETKSQCEEIGKVLQKYRSEPEYWTAAAMYQITRLFVSNLQAHLAQHFCTVVLLPRIRDDISHYKRLNFHLYQALSKTLYKPAAFFKGIIFPLCSYGDCSLREAIIIASLLANAHIPVAHSAAAILKIMSMDYHGANYIFLRVLFDKKYALPYRVIEETVKNFKSFKTDERVLPVLWHQTLLSFVQRYKNDLTSEQKKEIFQITTFQSHYKITPLIRRELEDSSNLERMDVN